MEKLIKRLITESQKSGLVTVMPSSLFEEMIEALRNVEAPPKQEIPRYISPR
jgi:hypothetical protein